MSLNLEEKFKTHCNTQNLELNPNQITLVKQLDNFYKENFNCKTEYGIYGGRNPLKNSHSVIDRPESDILVYPPISIIAQIDNVRDNSQIENVLIFKVIIIKYFCTKHEVL